jgi:hypothetical protein
VPARAPRTEVAVLLSAALADDGLWARGVGRLIAHALDGQLGGGAAVTVLSASAGRLVVAPTPLDGPHALQAAALAGAPRALRLHLSRDASDDRALAVDVFDGDTGECTLARAYAWPQAAPPPLAQIVADLAAPLHLPAGPPAALPRGQPLESFLHALDRAALAEFGGGPRVPIQDPDFAGSGSWDQVMVLPAGG